jgi:hypothetical protein
MSYAEIMNKIKISKNRVERHQKAIFKEQEIQQTLLKELGNDISAVTGETVSVITKSGKYANYNRDAIAARIVELREGQNMSFTTIAATLNAEGYKPRTAKAFSQATVYQIYDNMVKKIAAVATA